MTMTHARIRHLEIGCTAIQWTIIVCAVVTMLRLAAWPTLLPEPHLASAATVDGGADVDGSSRDSLASLKAIWGRDLRQALIVPVPKAAAPPKPPPPPPPVKLPKLVGTFVERGQGWGVFHDAKGAVRVRAATGSIDGFEIVDVTPGAARLRQGESSYDVKAPILPTKRPQKKRKRRGLGN